MSSTAVPGVPAGTWLGHPKGLFLLFATEMWERFSYYGMRALLVLSLIAGVEVANPGFGWSQSEALKLYGLFTGFVYFTPLIGGWLADNYLGQRLSVSIGGLVMAVLNNGLQLMSVGSQATQMIKGLVLLAAVAIDVWQKRQGRPSISGLIFRGKNAGPNGEIDPLDVARGSELFRLNCASCHNFTGRGGALSSGKYAPELDAATPAQIYTAMLTVADEAGGLAVIAHPREKRPFVPGLGEYPWGFGTGHPVAGIEVFSGGIATSARAASLRTRGSTSIVSAASPQPVAES